MLEATLRGSVVEKIRVMAVLVYNIGVERFGIGKRKSTEEKRKGGPSRRQGKITELRRQIWRLTKRWKEASRVEDAEEMEGLAELRMDLRSQLKSLRRAEAHARSGS